MGDWLTLARRALAGCDGLFSCVASSDCVRARARYKLRRRTKLHTPTFRPTFKPYSVSKVLAAQERRNAKAKKAAENNEKPIVEMEKADTPVKE